MEKRIKELVKLLNYHTELYNKGVPVISDREWDDMYFELIQLERLSNIFLPDSPTQHIHGQVVDSLKKVQHNHPMLSLDKTKNLDDVKTFFHDSDNVIAMCKMDGLTCSLRYVDGELVSAETRGDGEVGEDVLHNALVIPSIPKHISYKKELVVDGEIICPKNVFTSFNNLYKNARNFAAGSIRLLNSQECSSRSLTFVAWDIIKGLEEYDNLNRALQFLNEELFFTVVPYSIMVQHRPLEETVQIIKDFADRNYYPIDGIVFKYNSREYGKKLGRTDHHFKNALAYKFYDESYTTTLRHIEWTMGRTGVLTPVAVFEPIEIDGATVQRASLHNVSIMMELLGYPYRGQQLQIFKSNMIIPQVGSAIKKEFGTDGFSFFIPAYPTKCPICGKDTEIVEGNGEVQVLKCTNEHCEGRFINQIDHFCSKKGLDIKGLSCATLEKLIDYGWVNELSDIYTLENHKQEWIQKPGFGEKSVTKILNAIEQSKTNSTLVDFIAALGIPLIGKSVAKELFGDLETYEDFRSFVKNNGNTNTYSARLLSVLSYSYEQADKIAKEFTFITKAKNNQAVIENILNEDIKEKHFVVTGKLNHFKNRTELTELIEKYGGKVVSAVNSKTDFLINNDVNSNSAKNIKAKDLGIPILSEEELIKMLRI